MPASPGAPDITARIHILVFGDVQGVFFRAGTVSEAKRLGLTGWVRNNPDGSVEMIAQGGREQLQKLLEWCAHGPAGASVSRVEHEWIGTLVDKGGRKESGADAGFVGFRVRYD
jgi:acylphosphatase